MIKVNALDAPKTEVYMSVFHESDTMPTENQPSVIAFPQQENMPYWAHVEDRQSHRDPETTATGATIYSELVTFHDSLGRTTVRELTIADPNSNLVTVSPYPWVETDPWTTGQSGLNRDKIRKYADLGFTVLWLHHAGRYSPIAKDKSVSRSAHQMHALLDNMAETGDTQTNQVVLGGYSRGAMTAEKFIASSDRYGRAVMFSDTEAPCFVQDMNQFEKLNAIIRQVPEEAIGIGKVALKLIGRSIIEGDPTILPRYTKTLDMHPKNLAQEFMWAKALVHASVGHSISALPENSIGVRTFFSGDIMSQQTRYEALYESFPNITVLTEKGPHVAGAYPEKLAKKYARMQRLMDYMQDHSMSLLGVLPEHIIAPAEQKPARRRHLYSVRAS